MLESWAPETRAHLQDELAAPATDGPTSESALPGKWQGTGAGAAAGQVLHLRPGTVGSTDVTVGEHEVFTPMDASMPLEEIVALATVGNTAGLRRMLGRYRAMHAAVRKHLEGRLEHETARAQRLQVREALGACSRRHLSCHVKGGQQGHARCGVVNGTLE